MTKSAGEQHYADACNADEGGLHEVTIGINGVWATFGYHPAASGVTRAFCSGEPGQKVEVQDAAAWLQVVGFILDDDGIWEDGGWLFTAYQDVRAVAPGGR